MEFLKFYVWLEVLSGPFWVALIVGFLGIRWVAMCIARHLMSKHAIAAGYQPETVVRNNKHHADALARYIVSACMSALMMVFLITLVMLALWAESAGVDLDINLILFVGTVASLCVGKYIVHAARSAYENLDDFVRKLQEGSPHFSSK